MQQYLITCFDLPEVKGAVEAKVLDEAIVESDTLKNTNFLKSNLPQNKLMP